MNLSTSRTPAVLCIAVIALLLCWGTGRAGTGHGSASSVPAFCHFTVSGEIGASTLAYVRAQFNSLPRLNAKVARNCIVSFDSAGGDVESAIEIGRVLRAQHATTVIPTSATCASACVLAFLGGAQRIAGGRIGIHRPYSSGLSTSVGESEHSYTHVNELVKAYLFEMNVPTELLAAMNGTPPDQVMWLSANEAASFHITGDDPAWADYQDSRIAKALGISKETLYERRNQAKRLCTDEGDLARQAMCKYRVIYGGVR